MRIFYGNSNKLIDVTDICLSNLTKNNIIRIPSGDKNRAKYFTDPLIGIVKKIIIIFNNNSTEYDHNMQIKINKINNLITTITNDDINNTIKNIHSKLKLKYGSFDEELPEQKMVVRYLTGNEKVLNN